MRTAINIPNFGDFADPAVVATVARRAEAAGWDGLFVWDHLVYDKAEPPDIADPWMLLAVAATVTERIQLGPMITPVARRRVSTLARQTATLDRLSGGRVIFGTGLGAPLDAEFAPFGEPIDPRVVAARLDEGLEALALLWTGRPVTYRGEHIVVDGVTFLPPAGPAGRLPVWVGGKWPRRTPMRRAARWDGAFPMFGGEERAVPPEPATVREAATFLQRCREEAGRAHEPFDLVACGASPTDPAGARSVLGPLMDAGLTWWQESMPWDDRLTSAPAILERIDLGPPRLD